MAGIFIIPQKLRSHTLGYICIVYISLFRIELCNFNLKEAVYMFFL